VPREEGDVEGDVKQYAEALKGATERITEQVLYIASSKNSKRKPSPSEQVGGRKQ